MKHILICIPFFLSACTTPPPPPQDNTSGVILVLVAILVVLAFLKFIYSVFSFLVKRGRDKLKRK